MLLDNRRTYIGRNTIDPNVGRDVGPEINWQTKQLICIVFYGGPSAKSLLAFFPSPYYGAQLKESR